MRVYDTDIEDIIEEEEGFVGKRGFGGEEDNIEDVVVVANDLCSSMIQTILSVDFEEDINTKSHELMSFEKVIVSLNVTFDENYSPAKNITHLEDDELVEEEAIEGSGIKTIVYADSDHAGDYVDRKSTSGVCTFMGCCLTSWFSKKQTALAISTTEAEYAYYEISWLLMDGLELEAVVKGQSLLKTICEDATRAIPNMGFNLVNVEGFLYLEIEVVCVEFGCHLGCGAECVSTCEIDRTWELEDFLPTKWVDTHFWLSLDSLDVGLFKRMYMVEVVCDDDG
ncbi:hypothetical protein Tco_0213884 [Tanacetum coccineum]